MTNDPEDVIAKLRRAHQMSISGPSVADDATLYGQAAQTLAQVLQQRDRAREEMRDKSKDNRLASERRSWATLVPEEALYPSRFHLVGTTTGVSMSARLSGNRIYHRNGDGMLQPIPGEVWQHQETGKLYLVLCTAEYRHHAVIDVEEYHGPLPEAGAWAS